MLLFPDSDIAKHRVILKRKIRLAGLTIPYLNNMETSDLEFLAAEPITDKDFATLSFVKNIARLKEHVEK